MDTKTTTHKLTKKNQEKIQHTDITWFTLQARAMSTTKRRTNFIKEDPNTSPQRKSLTIMHTNTIDHSLNYAR